MEANKISAKLPDVWSDDFRFKSRWTKTFVSVNFACRVKRTKMWDSL